jgi:flavin reductase (DIM6/NTAB) family NADH-FMN oxidoreductase RutF
VKAQEFKDAMGKFPTGVAIITTRFNETLYGFTANSFTSVSLTPPLVSFCYSKSAAGINAFKNYDKFAVSILSENQAALSRHFAQPMIDKFSNIKYKIGELTQCPLIAGAACWIECAKIHEYDGGDHIIFIGEAKSATIHQGFKPLIYFARNYWQLA